jgi:hypothetical protein
VADLVVDVQVDRAALRKQDAQQLEAFAQEGEERLARERVGVGDLSPAGTADGAGPAGADTESRVRCERGIDVDEVDATGQAALADQRLHGSDVVAVDEQALEAALVLGCSCISLLGCRLDSNDRVHGGEG